jgi:hypothetical protein
MQHKVSKVSAVDVHMSANGDTELCLVDMYKYWRTNELNIRNQFFDTVESAKV